MAVRFLPPDEENRQPRATEREDLAEVISLRSRLPGRSWGEPVPPSDRESDSRLAPEDQMASETESAPEADPVPEVEAGVPAHSAYDDGVRLLARKAYTSGELLAELVRIGHEHLEAEIVIAEFERSNYLDDLGLARVTAEKLRENKGASRSQIRRKLFERRLPDDVVETALAELGDEEELELLVQTANDRARRLASLDRQAAERRLLGFLARRGWTGEPARRAAKEALDG